jgi:predicted Zn-dependent protease
MKLLPVVVAALVGWGCATNPATGRRQLILMSEQEEIQIGRQADAEIRKQMGLYDNPALQEYVRSLGARLVTAAHRPGLPWTFAVVDEAAVNAFALPGGFIYVTRGIVPFMRNEAELAGVLGHEIGHVDARHSAEAYSRQLGAGLGLAVAGILVPETQPLQGVAGAGLGVLFLRYGREAELESDRLGVRYTSMTGWDPRGVPGMLSTLARLDQANGSTRGIPNWALTHPPAADRVQRLDEVVAGVDTTAARTIGVEALERHLDGLVFGDSREKGIVRGRDFLHPLLRIALRFPEGWSISNTNERVLAQPEKIQNVGMLLELADGTGPVDRVAAAAMTKAGWQERTGARTSVNGLDAYVGTYEAVSGSTRLTARAAHVQAGSRIVVVAGLAPDPAFSAHSSAFDEAIASFRTLTQAEADRIQPNRVRFHVVRAGDTWESIARVHAATGVTAVSLAIMNGSDGKTPPGQGTRIRVVVAG